MKHSISLVIFLAVAVVVWWSITTNYNKDKHLHEVTDQEYAEIFMNNFEMISMNEKGTPDYILKGQQLQRYSHSDNTEIKQPVFQLLQENRHWKVSADSAIINDKKETLELTDNVIMQQQNIDPAVTIRTQNLLINTQTQITETKADVDITRGSSRIRSRGMVYNNITSELELTNQVHGQYMPYE